MEPSYDSSEWASDDESQRISQKPLCQPRPKRVCQVPGCTADLEAIGKPYCSVKRICPIHMKADIIPARNQIMRFCQQCGVLEPLSLFDFTKRSCRDSLSRRVKHTPAESEQRPKRRRKPHTSSSDATGHSAPWPLPYDWAAIDTAAAAAAAFGGLTQAGGWDAAYAAAAGPVPELCELAAAEAAAWGSTAAGLVLPNNSGWLEVPAAEQAGPAAAAATATAAAAAAAHDGSSHESLVSPASSSCTAAAAAGAAAAPAALFCGGSFAAMMAPGSLGSPPACTTYLQQQVPVQQQQRQLPCTQGLAAAAAAGLSSPGSGSYSSSGMADQAVLELEQFMLQELAAAGVIVNDSNSATPLPAVPASVPAPAPAHFTWHHAPVPQQQQEQQQQQATRVNHAVQYQQPQPMQPPRQSPQPMQQQQASCTMLPAHRNCSNPVAAAGMAAGCAGNSTPAAAGVWVPAAACGTSLPSPAAFSAPQQQQQQGALRAPPSSAASGGTTAGRGGSHRSEMMSRLQSRLQVLQSQMEDMQLMLGLLQEA